MLKEKIQADQLEALKSGNKKTLDTLRYILAQIKNKEIEKRESLTDDEVVAILKKQVKELQESIDAFEKGGRQDLVGENKDQQAIIKPYLPEEISDEELQKEIQRIIEANKDLYEKNPKTLIGICMKELKNKADPSRIMRMINSL